MYYKKNRRGARDYCLFVMVVEMERVGAIEAIPPVVARILSGDSTSPLTRGVSLVRSKVLLSFCNGCGDEEGRCN